MSHLADMLHEARKTSDCSRLTEVIPYTRFLGIKLDCAGSEIIGTMPFADMLVGNPMIPALHGGTIGALLESTAICQLLCEQEEPSLPKTINITIDFLRSGKAVDTHASGVITKHGRRMVDVRTLAWQEDRGRPIAVANAHFLAG